MHLGGTVRSSKKGPYIDAKLQAKIETLNRGRATAVIRTWARACTIFPGMVGHTIAIHNGRQHVPILVTRADGWSQARRIRADPDLSRARQGCRSQGSAVTGREGSITDGSTAHLGRVRVSARKATTGRGCGSREAGARGAGTCFGSFRTRRQLSSRN